MTVLSEYNWAWIENAEVKYGMVKANKQQLLS